MIPFYLMRRLVIPGGGRPSKRPIFENMIAGLCAACDRPVMWLKVKGVKDLDGVWRSGDYYHRGVCEPAPVRGWSRDWDMPSVVAGNLNQEEYRFWIGMKVSRFGDSTRAICRACRKEVWSFEARKLHKEETKYWVGNENCTTRLVTVYKRLLSQPECIICHKNRFGGKKWGVPICEQPECESEWKFGEQRWAALEKELYEQQQKAAFMEERGLKGNLSPVQVYNHDTGAYITKAWCNMCQMMADNPKHEETHVALILKGEGGRFD